MTNFRLRVSFLNVILSLNVIEQNLCDIAASPLSPTNFQIYKKWPSPVFCFSKSMVYWVTKSIKLKNFFVRFLFYGY